MAKIMKPFEAKFNIWICNNYYVTFIIKYNGRLRLLLITKVSSFTFVSCNKHGVI